MSVAELSQLEELLFAFLSQSGNTGCFRTYLTNLRVLFIRS